MVLCCSLWKMERISWQRALTRKKLRLNFHVGPCSNDVRSRIGDDRTLCKEIECWKKSSTLKKFDRVKVRFARCDNDNENDEDSVENDCIVVVLSGRLFRIGGKSRRKMRKFYLSLIGIARGTLIRPAKQTGRAPRGQSNPKLISTMQARAPVGSKTFYRKNEKQKEKSETRRENERETKRKCVFMTKRVVAPFSLFQSSLARFRFSTDLTSLFISISYFIFHLISFHLINFLINFHFVNYCSWSFI